MLTTAVLNVMSAARAHTSPTVTSGAKRMPPFAGPGRQIDGDDGGVDVHCFDTGVGEQAAGQFVGGSVAEDLLVGAVALVTHAGEAAVEVETHHAVAATRLLADGNGLAHGSGDHTA